MPDDQRPSRMSIPKADATMSRSCKYICLVLAGFALVPSYADDLSNEALARRIQELEKRLSAIESIPQVAAMLKLREAVNALPSPSPTPQADAPLEITQWGYKFQDAKYDFDKRHLIHYTLKNRTQRAIKLVDGSLIFRDLLGEKMLTIRLEQDAFYPAGGSYETEGAWDVNPIEPEQMRLQRMDHDDIKPELVIRRVVFDDNTVWSATP